MHRGWSKGVDPWLTGEVLRLFRAVVKEAYVLVVVYSASMLAVLRAGAIAPILYLKRHIYTEELCISASLAYTGTRF
jgi:ABC-type histidine transport system ATPase subunit